jgi:uncharacterized protein (DUF2147 family)
MKSLWALAAATLAALPLSASAQNSASLVGRWQTPTRHGVVEITACGNSLCGRLVDSDGLRANPALRDTHNKDVAQRERLLKGLLILQGFSPKGQEWTGGTIYNAEDGGTYQATLTPAGADTLKLKGCIVWPLCKTQVWTRLK